MTTQDEQGATAEQGSDPQAVVYDYERQRDLVAAGLIPGERLLAVLDAKGAGSGFLGLTDRRLLLQDKSLVGGKVSLVSVPYSRVTSVGYVADRDFGVEAVSTSSIVITISGGTHQVEFRGAEKARYAHDTILWHLMEG